MIPLTRLSVTNLPSVLSAPPSHQPTPPPFGSRFPTKNSSASRSIATVALTTTSGSNTNAA
jgi:hypothetical protein